MLAIQNFFRWHPIISSILGGALIGICAVLHEYLKIDKYVPVSLIGVHHLGSDYYIKKFYINKSIGDNIGEGGGGGSMVCCLSLPKTWQPASTVDIRWEVHRILRVSALISQETAEVEGIYRAQVPIERYTEPGDFYVHFFSGKRVRVVVSSTSSSGEHHPIQRLDDLASKNATLGVSIEKMFTDEELAEKLRDVERDRKKFGDWR